MHLRDCITFPFALFYVSSDDISLILSAETTINK